MFVDDSPLSRAIRMCYNLRNRGANLAAMSRLFRNFLCGRFDGDANSCLGGHGSDNQFGSFYVTYLAPVSHPHPSSKAARDLQFSVSFEQTYTCPRCTAYYKTFTTTHAEIVLCSETTSIASSESAFNLQFQAWRNATSHCVVCNEHNTTPPSSTEFSQLPYSFIFTSHAVSVPSSFHINERIVHPSGTSYVLVAVVYANGTHYWCQARRLLRSNTASEWVFLDDYNNDFWDDSSNKPALGRQIDKQQLHALVYIKERLPQVRPLWSPKQHPAALLT